MNNGIWSTKLKSNLYYPAFTGADRCFTGILAPPLHANRLGCWLGVDAQICTQNTSPSSRDPVKYLGLNIFPSIGVVMPDGAEFLVKLIYQRPPIGY
jgi:hypothetical protein